MAAGRVCTGFSLPYVARYKNDSGTVSYTDGQKLARGVSVSISVESDGENKFYADNVAAESAGARFKSGTVTQTVDGLTPAAARLIHGLPRADAKGWTPYGDESTDVYCGFGYVARYMSDGVTTYVPTILPKIMYDPDKSEAKTQEDSIEWQTQELTATIYRDDTSGRNWKYVSDTEYETEAAAEEAIKTFLGITTTAAAESSSTTSTK